MRVLPLNPTRPSLFRLWFLLLLPFGSHGIRDAHPTSIVAGPGGPSTRTSHRTPSSQSVQAVNIPNDFNQCVFLRYYTMRERKWMPGIPKVIKAGAGPHDLGSGDNKGDTFPELTTQSNVDSADPPTSDDEGLGGRRSPTAGGSDSEPDIVVRNTSYVWTLSSSLVSL
jgi:hypothetical protein